MAKNKKFAPEVETAPVTQETGVVAETAVPTDAPAKPLIPRNPSLYLQRTTDGVQYKFDRRELPKKAPQSGAIVIDGVHTPFQITSNKGWSKDEDHVLEYIWVTLPSGVTGYITGDYKQSVAEMSGQEFTVGEGKANRENPSRIGDDAKEAARKAAAAATLAAKKAAQPETPAEQPEEAPASA